MDCLNKKGERRYLITYSSNKNKIEPLFFAIECACHLHVLSVIEGIVGEEGD